MLAGHCPPGAPRYHRQPGDQGLPQCPHSALWRLYFDIDTVMNRHGPNVDAVDGCSIKIDEIYSCPARTRAAATIMGT